MEIYLDTADLDAIAELIRVLPVAGVTTNPSIVAAGRIPLPELLPRIRALLGKRGRIFAQVLSREAEAMVDEAVRLRGLDPDLVVKVPAVPEGIAAIKELSARGIPCLGTAVYGPLQGLMAAHAGARYVAPYVNRLDATGGDGIGLVRSLQKLLDLHADGCEVLAASFRTPTQVLDCLLAGAGAVTLPPDVARQLLASPAVDAALRRFESDWTAAFGALTA